MTSSTSASGPIKWEGKQAFYISGTEHDEDTIRIVADQKATERSLMLVLPTLCITYADMKFANDIGGVQLDYPDSTLYGSGYFDPPVVLNGEEEIRKFTWIRGAQRVEIGPRETIIEWQCWRTLVIPRLRIKADDKAKALLSVPEVTITVSQPFIAKVSQYADGRHVGGVQLIKRHPDWKPAPIPQQYDLWVRVIDGTSRCAIPKAMVKLYTWEAEKNRGQGAFILEASRYTDEMGIVDATGLPCSDKKLVIVESKQWQPQTWRFRPLPGQKAKRIFKLWQSKQTQCSYEMRVQDTLNSIAVLAGSRQTTILKMNHMRSAREINPSKKIKIPCFEAIYRVEARDTFERVAKYFCYNSVGELATANHLTEPYEIYQDQGLHLPGWYFFRARPDDLFEKLDEQFSLPRGWSRPAQRTLHDNPIQAYEGEVVAIPTQEFVSKNTLRRLY
jgi:hypothetical protein